MPEERLEEVVGKTTVEFPLPRDAQEIKELLHYVGLKLRRRVAYEIREGINRDYTGEEATLTTTGLEVRGSFYDLVEGTIASFRCKKSDTCFDAQRVNSLQFNAVMSHNARKEVALWDRIKREIGQYFAEISEPVTPLPTGERHCDD